MWALNIKPRSQLAEKPLYLLSYLPRPACVIFESPHLAQLTLNSQSSYVCLYEAGTSFGLLCPASFHNLYISATAERPSATQQSNSWVGRGPRETQISITKQ